MTMPRSMAIYLAGPMLDYTGDFHHTTAQEWREGLAGLAPTGVLFVSPAHAFFGSSPITAPVLDRVERHMLAACDGVLANLLDEHPAFGTIRDIEFARQLGKPVAVAGRIHSLMAHDLRIDTTLEGALDQLVDAIRQEQDAPPFPFGVIHVQHEHPDEDD